MATLTTYFQLLRETQYTVTGNNALRLYGKYLGQDIASNRTTVQFQLRTIAYSGSYYSADNHSDLWCSGVHRGTQHFDIGTVNTSGEKTIGTWTFDLYHNDQGVYSGVVSASSNVYGSITPGTGDVSFALPTIPRKSTPTLNKSTLTIGNDLIVYTNRKSSAFTHTVKFTYGTYSKTVIGVTTSTTIKTSEIKEELYKQIPNSKSGWGTVDLITYNGSTNLGTNSIRVTLNVNEEECKPILTDFAIEDINTLTLSLTGNNQTFIKGYSNLKYTIEEATPNYSATIVKYRFADGQEETGLIHITNSINDKTVSVVAVDSRGLSSNVVTKTINLLEYVNPRLNEITPLRENGIDEYVNMRVKASLWNGDFGKANNQVSYFGYSINGGSFYDKTSEFNNLIVGQEVNNIDTIIRIYSDGESANFNKGQSYTVVVKIVDGLNNVQFNEYVLNSVIEDGKVAISYFQDNDGEYHIGLNGMPREDSIVSINGLRFIYKESE